MDRLPLLKALADDSRYAIFVEMGRASRPLSTMELAERLELHPNTVRLHLERLRDVGLVEVSTAGHGTVGRPQHRWALSVNAPSLGLEPSGLRLLAHLLAETAAAAQPDAATLGAIGRDAGLERSAATTRAAGRSARRPPGPSPSCVRAVLDELADLGFDPVLEGDGDGPVQAVAFTRCPFRELAVAYPDLVCTLHRGITEGIVAGAVARTPGTTAEVASFSSLVDRDPCRVELAVQAAD